MKRWALLACAALTAACGTTAHFNSSATSAGGGGDGLSLGTTVVPNSANASISGTVPGTITATPGAQGATSTTLGIAPTLAGTTPATSGPTGTPIAAGADIPIAFFYVNGGNQVLSSVFPGTSVAFGNGKAEAQALINDVNGHGGINGRHLRPYFVPIQATNATDTALQQACLGAVQDDHPFAILSIFNVSGGLAACATQTHTLFLDVALGAGDDEIYNTAPNYLFTPTQISRDAEQRLILGLAHAEGRITPSTRVGILSEADDPMYGRVVTRTIEPLLSSWGVPYIAESLSQGADTSGMSSAVLRFKTANVSSVVFSLGSGGIPEVLFMDAADLQAFFPAYLMGDSTDTSFVGGSALSTEAKRIWGAGTMPLANVATGRYPTTPGEQACISLMNASFSPGYRDRGTSLTATLYCDLVDVFVAVGRSVQGPLDAASWVAAYRGFGTRYTAVTTFATDFSAAANYGASEYRELSWLPACSCVTYTSPVRPIG
jgi:hypothetical protein